MEGAPMPDPNLPPLITFSTPRTTQPYQEKFLAALDDGSRLETWPERWNRERNESRERFNDAIKRITDGSTIDLDKLENAIKRTTISLLAFGQLAAKLWQASARFYQRPCRYKWEFEQRPTIGRKRRARRARGRRRGNA